MIMAHRTQMIMIVMIMAHRTQMMMIVMIMTYRTQMMMIVMIMTHCTQMMMIVMITTYIVAIHNAAEILLQTDERTDEQGDSWSRIFTKYTQLYQGPEQAAA